MPCYEIDGIRPVIDKTAFVHPTAVLIGDVIIGAGCYIGPVCSLRGDFGRLVVEAGANVQDTCVMHGFPDTDSVVERDGHIGHGAVLHGCRVRENALVGMNAVIMDGAIVGASSIVAAMAFVKAGEEIAERTLVAGSPARVIRELSDEEIEWKSRGTGEYQQLTRRCFASMVEVEPLSREERNRPRIEVSDTIPLYQMRENRS